MSKTPEDMFIALIVFIKPILIFFFINDGIYLKKFDAMMSLVTVFNCMQKKPLTFKQIFKFLSVILVCYLLQN